MIRCNIMVENIKNVYPITTINSIKNIMLYFKSQNFIVHHYKNENNMYFFRDKNISDKYDRLFIIRINEYSSEYVCLYYNNNNTEYPLINVKKIHKKYPIKVYENINSIYQLCSSLYDSIKLIYEDNDYV